MLTVPSILPTFCLCHPQNSFQKCVLLLSPFYWKDWSLWIFKWLRKIPAGLILGSGGLSLGCLSNPWPQISPSPILCLLGFFFQFVLGLLLVPGHLYEIGTFPPDPEGFSSEPHAAMSVPRVTPFPPFFTWTSSVSHQSHKSSIQISLFWQPVFLSGLASSYYPSGILQIRDWGEGQASSCFYSTPSPELPWLTFCSAALQGHSFHVPLPFYHIKNTWKLHKDFHSHEWRRNTFW